MKSCKCGEKKVIIKTIIYLNHGHGIIKIKRNEKKLYKIIIKIEDDKYGRIAGEVPVVKEMVRSRWEIAAIKSSIIFLNAFMKPENFEIHLKFRPILQEIVLIGIALRYQMS